MTALVWFRQDLRITDNQALLQACSNHQHVVAVLCSWPEQWQQHDWAPIKADLYERQANHLGQALAAKGIQLHHIELDTYAGTPKALHQFCQKHDVEALYANRDYPLDEVRRDRAVNAWLEEHEIECHWFDSNVLLEPGSVTPKTAGYYKKFTPFFKSWLALLAQRGLTQPSRIESRSECEFTPIQIHYDKRDASSWAASEDAIKQRLRRFTDEQVQDYARARDLPALDATSRLSPFFELGVISPVTVARMLQQQSPDFPHGLNQGAHTWLSELAWREFYLHLMYAVPRLSMGKAFLEYTDAYPWRSNDSDFKRWREGNTGFPIVDAGMRQLKAEGWMHNRVRMIVANFLVKDLRLDWRLGERYFMQNLIDGSFAANNGGWQWSASTGTDAAPYFRVFNPTRQSEKVDPEGRYIRKWVSALKDVPNKYIHEPHQYLRARGSDQNGDTKYPQPMVDHSQARDDFIATFKGLKK
ncbi:MAG: deoxyribodipyrimidine photo-lyase [Firmicutes bacterium]|nr:deoxyribodipyrimidine photo-lyase [Bacillota bacterium]